MAHVAFAFESDGSFRNGSAERGESLLAIFKRFVALGMKRRNEEDRSGESRHYSEKKKYHLVQKMKHIDLKSERDTYAITF